MDTGDDYPLPPGNAAAERRNTGDASPPNAGTANSHQRVYQACIPCRQRKVKCDLGSVDNPHDPPCSRCRRESKQCFFASERRKKRKTGDHPGPEESDEGIFEIRNGTRKRVKASEERDPIRDGEDLERPRTPGGSLGQARPLQRPNAGKPVQYKEEDERASEHTTALLQHRELHSGHDALNMLHAAATTIQNRAIGDGRAAFASPGGGQFSSTTSPIPGGAGNGSFSGTSAPIAQRNGAVADRSMGVSSTYNPTEPSAEYTSAVRAWQRFRFVRAGWFTADEGIEYISYFYTHLAPLTPVALPNFRSLETHKKLLEEETMLALTMLLIASRHMRLNGPGSNSRPYAIHDTLWTYLSGMIARVMWGQEQFGGGFCGAGNQPGCDVNPLHRKGMRTLGSVESLVLLTEWHPRAMHFPPAQDDSELMQPEPIQVISDTADLNTASKGIGGQRMDAWLEPCWRSDRMCWMLLGLAMTLAFEIGIFDSSEWQRHTRTLYGQTLSPDELDAYNRRRGNVRDLLLVYVTQTSGRLGLTSMLPSSYNDPEGSKLHNKQIGPLDSIQDATLHFWLRMASLMKQGNTKIFPNKDATRNLIRTRKYREVLAELQIPLEQWRKDFDRCKQIPKVMRSILLIEWEYARAYVNSLSLQAVAERCARDDVHPMDPPLEMARSVSKSGDIPMTPSALSKHFSGERHFLVKVAESARSLLKIVVDDLYPNDYLKHAPVRTYFRIISVAILMFKTFVLGAFESDISGSLGLLVKTIDALRTCIVDDVHVASRFAELLETLTNNLKPRLVRMAADGRGGKPLRSRRGSSHGSPLLQADVAATNNGNYTGPQSQYPAQQLPAAMSNSTPWSPNLVSPANIPGSNHPLLGVSDDTYDLTANNNSWSIMPPPGFNNHSPNNNSNNTMGSGASGTYDTYATDTFGMSNDQDWFALPMDPLLSLSGTDVTHTQFGPDIGGHDMLELLLNGSNGFQ